MSQIILSVWLSCDYKRFNRLSGLCALDTSHVQPPLTFHYPFVSAKNVSRVFQYPLLLGRTNWAENHCSLLLFSIVPKPLTSAVNSSEKARKQETPTLESDRFRYKSCLLSGPGSCDTQYPWGHLGSSISLPNRRSQRFGGDGSVLGRGRPRRDWTTLGASWEGRSWRHRWQRRVRRTETPREIPVGHI